MLEDHSSRWSAAASPGGLIGLVLAILSVMALVTAILGLTGRFEIALDDTVLFAVLGLAAFASFIFIYLLISYVLISYRLDAEKLTISWGLWSEAVPYDEIEAVEPANDVLGEQSRGWLPFWPGYYVGTQNLDVGRVRVVSTLPARRQILLTRADGEIFAISPERPLLFMEELARWHRAYVDRIGVQTSVSTSMTMPAPVDARHASGELSDELPESNRSVSPDAAQQPAQSDAGLQGNGAAAPEPVFGARVAADPPAPDKPVFGTVPPETARPYLPPPEYVGPELPAEPDPDTARYPVVFGATSAVPEHGIGQAYQQFVQAGWTQEQPAVEAHSASIDSAAHPKFAPPKPVILPAGTPRSEVLQPLTRVYRSEPQATSPAIRPTIHRDPVALAFIGIGFLTTAAMAVYILLQFDDIPPSLILHWNVDGMPGRAGSPEEIWVLPVIALLVFLANIGLAWSVAQFDRFAARLMLSSTLVVHIVTWIAVIMILH